MGYRVDLDIFAGPLDLLLYLVRKDEVDIYDIPISHITEQYVNHIEMLKKLDIDLAGSFLVMAATLMEIKSAMLLPRPEIEDEDAEDSGDPRAELIRQLLEYKRFKDAANMLSESAESRKLRHGRPDSIIVSLKADDEPEVDLEQISVWTLLEAFDQLMQATGRLMKIDHITDDTPIDLYQVDILHRLQSEGPSSFEDIFKDSNNRLVMIGLFLAMLELIRSKLIGIEQPKAFDTIYLRSLTDEPAQQAVQNAIIKITEQEEPAKAVIPIVEIPAKDDIGSIAGEPEPELGGQSAL